MHTFYTTAFLILFLVQAHGQDSYKAGTTCTSIVAVAEEMPTFSECQNKENSWSKRSNCADWRLGKKIDNLFLYPEEALEQQIEGELHTNFIINTSGKIENIQFENSLGYGCEEEVVRILTSLPAFIPAKIKGEPVCIYKNLKIRFKLNYKPFEEVFQVVEKMPAFRGCDKSMDKTEYRNCSNKKMLEYIYRNLEYPQEAKEKQISGTVVIQFIVDENGAVLDPVVTKSVEKSIDEEALRVVSSMPDFLPGLQNGKPVKVYFNMPIKFRSSRR